MIPEYGAYNGGPVTGVHRSVYPAYANYLKILIILVILCIWRFQYNSAAFDPGCGVFCCYAVAVNPILFRLIRRRQ